MELVTIDCDLIANPMKSTENPTEISISINFRRIRQIVYRKPNGHETIKEHRVVSHPMKLHYKISSVLNINSVLNKSKLQTNSWVKKKVSALIYSKAVNCMRDGEAYTVKADVDVIFEKRIDYLQKEEESLEKKKKEEEEKSCAICLGELSGGVGCTEIQCSHVFHRDCILKWLRKNMTCPICRSVCVEDFCDCLVVSD